MPVSPLETNHGVMCVSLSNFQHLTSNLCSSLNPLTSTLPRDASASPVASTLTRKLHFKPFRINTYKKGGEGEGGTPLQPRTSVRPILAGSPPPQFSRTINQHTTHT